MRMQKIIEKKILIKIPILQEKNECWIIGTYPGELTEGLDCPAGRLERTRSGLPDTGDPVARQARQLHRWPRPPSQQLSPPVGGYCWVAGLAAALSTAPGTGPGSSNKKINFLLIYRYQYHFYSSPILS